MKTDAFEVPKIGKKMQKRGVLLSEKGGTTVKWPLKSTDNIGTFWGMFCLIKRE